MNKIPVVMTTDRNYVIPTMTAIYSIMDSVGETTFYQFHILCKEGFDKDSRNKIWALIQKYSNADIVFHEIKDLYFNLIEMKGRFPIASYYRLFISQIVKEDKCIFIDGDTIVQDDLARIYGETGLDRYYIAGVKNFTKIEIENYAQKLGVPSLDGYISAGFLILNLKKIREEQLDQKFINAIKDGYRFMDQDIINKYCYGKIKYLPLRYNFFADFFGGRADKTDCLVFSESEMHGAEKEVAVLHYTGVMKPWLCTRLKVNKIWWEYAKRALQEKDYDMQMEMARQFERESDWSSIVDKIKGEKEIVVVGFSETGKSLVDLVIKFKPNEMAGICDNDMKKQGSHYRGFFVQSVEKMFLLFPEAIWLIGSQASFAQIRKQLQELGVKDEKIIRYIYKSAQYYEGLDEEYKDFEMQMIQKMETA